MTWSTVKLKWAATTVAGGTPSVSEPSYWSDDSAGLPWVSIGDMSNRELVTTTGRRVTESGIESARLPIGNPGTLIVSMYASLGHTAFLTERATWNQAILAVYPSNSYFKKFIKYSLDSLRPTLSEIARSNTQANLNAEQVGNLAVPSPPLDEQRHIADFLDVEMERIDGLMQKRRQMRDLLALRRERVIESTLGLEDRAATRGLVPLKYLVADVTVGIVITPAKWYVDSSGTPALRGLNVKAGLISTDDLVQISAEGDAENCKSRLHAGDVVVVRTGQAGAAAVVPPELDGANCIDLIVVRPGVKIDPDYLQYVLNSDYARARISEHSVGSIQAHFNVGAMKQIPIPSISHGEQEEVVRSLRAKIGPLDLLQQKLEAQEKLLAERRQALITAAVTGQFDVSTASGRGVDVP